MGSRKSASKSAAPKQGFFAWLKGQSFGVLALGISAASLWLGIANRTDARLHDRPHLEYTFFYDDSGAGWRFGNTGLGQARLRGFKILVDGQPKNDLDDVWRSLGFPEPPKYNFTMPTVGDLYAAGHNNVFMWTRPGPDATKLMNEWPRVNISACYCSIYDECWVFDTAAARTPTGDRRDDECSTFKDDAKTKWWEG